MKITLQANSTNEQHTCFTVFVNGVNCGVLCMLVKDATTFYMIVSNGCHKKLDTFVGKGHWAKEDTH
jgi:hypothetical protein